MSCIITLKIKDYFPKIETIPYENFVCLFTYEDFFGKIPLIEKSNNICKHEIPTISSDIKYNIHILEYNESSLIGICEIVIPFIKIRRIKAPGTMVQEQKIKLIIDVNTKRKLFGKLINSGDIYLVLCAEVFIPDKNNIIINNDNNIKKNNDHFMKQNNNKKIKVRISDKKNLDGTPRTIKKKKMMMEMKSNREMIKNDNSDDNNNKNFNNTNNRNNTINYDFNYDEKNSTGIIRNKLKLENNQINIIDFRNKNDNLYNKNNDINLTTKEIKKLKINKKRSPRKKVTILELLEKKMQPILSNVNNINANESLNIRSNTNYNNGSSIKQNVEKENKTGKKILDIKKNNNDNRCLNINNTVKRIIKEEKINSNKLINSAINSPSVIIISPSHNKNSPITIGPNKIKRTNSKGINKINKKYKNNYNLYNGKSLNETEINKNNYNTLLTKKIRNSSQGKINRNSYNERDKIKKDSFKLGHNKRPKIDISIEMFQRKSMNNNNKQIKDIIYNNYNSYSKGRSFEMNSNNCLLSTDERTEQGLSEIDKKILEKGTELRDIFHNQIKNNNYSNNNVELNNSKNQSDKIKFNNLKNQKNIENLYYDMGTVENQIIGGANYTIETPKTNKDSDNFNIILDNKSSFCSSSQSLPLFITQEDLKNNYIGLIDLYYLLNKKLSKTIFENGDLNKKLKIYKENYNNEMKKEEIIKNKNDKYRFKSYLNIKIKKTINDKVLEHLAYIKNVESKLYQDIFGYTYDDYEIIRTKEIERVNKLNEDRKLKILLKVVQSIINDCGNVSQIFYNNKIKEKLLKNVLLKYNIKEKGQGDENYINLQTININYKYNKLNKYNNLINEDDIFENKIIREVDEDKEEEESVYTTSHKKKNNCHFYFNSEGNESQKNESIRKSLTQNNNEENETVKKEKGNIDKNINIDKKDKNSNIESTKINNIINDEENKKIEIMRKILIEDFIKKNGKTKSFNYINKNEYIYDDKYKILADLNDKNEVIIEIENNKYNLDEFISIYGKDDNNIEKNEINQKEIDKDKFIYKKKRGQQTNKKENEINEHQKKRRKRRIDDESGEEKDNTLSDKEEKNNINTDN